MNYFVVNKESDFLRGYGKGVCWKDNGITLLPGKEEGVFFSRVFDSQEEGNAWHRFVMEGEGQGLASFSVVFYAFDEQSVFVEGKVRLVPDIIRDPECPLPEKKRLLGPYAQKHVLSPRDCLLHEVKGRYLCFSAELLSQGGRAPFISRMILYFPREDWLKYLPGVYRKEKAGADFTSRYLGVFQSMYDDMDRRIHGSAGLMNVHAAPAEWLNVIAGWFQIKNIYLWPEDALRRLLKGAPEILGTAGTVQGMLDILKLYTGEEPVLIECGMLKGKKEEQFYTRDPYRCILLVREKYVPGPKEYEALLCLAGQIKPAHMEVRVVLLKQRICLGDYTYLGINSEIGSYRPARLDGGFALAFSAVGKAKRPFKDSAAGTKEEGGDEA